MPCYWRSSWTHRGAIKVLEAAEGWCQGLMRGDWGETVPVARVHSLLLCEGVDLRLPWRVAERMRTSCRSAGRLGWVR